MKKLVFGVLWGMCLASGMPAMAQSEFPTRTVKLTVAFGAGGATDIIARALADALQKELGQTVVVENVTGASGMVAAQRVAKAPGDGYTLLFTTNVQVINPALRLHIPFDTVADFTPIAIVASAPNVLAVNADSPFKTAKDYVAAAKAKADGLTYASAGVGTSTHLAAELFGQITSSKYINVPYTSTAAMVQSVAAGNVDSTWLGGQAVQPFVNAGKLRVLGVAGNKRSIYVPDAPTFAEQGYKDFTSYTWFGLFGPAHMPPAVVSKLTASTAKLLATKEMQDKLHAAGADEAEAVTGPQLARRISSEIGFYKGLVKAANIQLID